MLRLRLLIAEHTERALVFPRTAGRAAHKWPVTYLTPELSFVSPATLKTSELNFHPPPFLWPPQLCDQREWCLGLIHGFAKVNSWV